MCVSETRPMIYELGLSYVNTIVFMTVYPLIELNLSFTDII